MPRWTEETRKWGDLVDSLRSLEVDEVVVTETHQRFTCQTTAQRMAKKLGWRFHTHAVDGKVYILRTK